MHSHLMPKSSSQGQIYSQKSGRNFSQILLVSKNLAGNNKKPNEFMTERN